MFEQETQNPLDINPVRDWCLKHTSPGDLFVDCGAHIGRVSVPVAQKGNYVIAIEACPESAEILRKNLAPYKNSRVIEKVVFSSNGEVEFTTALDSHIQSSIFDRFSPNREAVRTEYLPSVTLNTILKDFPSGDVVLKMDIELSERFAWEGLGRSIKRVKAACMEFMPTILRADAKVDPQEFVDKIRIDGFDIYNLDGSEISEGELFSPTGSKVDLYLKRR